MQGGVFGLALGDWSAVCTAADYILTNLKEKGEEEEEEEEEKCAQTSAVYFLNVFGLERRLQTACLCITVSCIAAKVVKNIERNAHKEITQSSFAFWKLWQ